MCLDATLMSNNNAECNPCTRADTLHQSSGALTGGAGGAAQSAARPQLLLSHQPAAQVSCE